MKMSAKIKIFTSREWYLYLPDWY